MMTRIVKKLDIGRYEGIRHHDFGANDLGGPELVPDGSLIPHHVKQVLVVVRVHELRRCKHFEQLLKHFDHRVASVLHRLNRLNLGAHEAV